MRSDKCESGEGVKDLLHALALDRVSTGAQAHW